MTFSQAIRAYKRIFLQENGPRAFHGRSPSYQLPAVSHLLWIIQCLSRLVKHLPSIITVIIEKLNTRPLLHLIALEPPHGGKSFHYVSAPVTMMTENKE
jgi:hypothetical protein